MNILELQEKRLNLQNELTNIVNESETRALEDNENSRLAEIRTEIDGIDKEIEEIEAENRKLQQEQKNNKENKTDNKMEFRLFNAIKGVAEGNVPEELRSMVNGNKITYRANEIVAGVDAQGGYNVPEEKKDLFMAIRNASVLNKIGATWFSNAVGDISIPKYAGSTCGWKGEIDAADNGAGAFSEVLLTPKRLTAYLDISKTFLAQDANSAEALLINDLAKAVSEKLDQTIFGAESGTTTRPAGLFNVITAETGTSLTSVDYDDILGLESKVEEKNGTDFIFIANPKVKYALKGVDMAEGYGHMVYAGGEIDGYKTVVSNSVNNKSILCMDPKDLAVATWDGIDITVDTVSRAINNEVRIVVNFLVDAKLRGDRISGAIFD
jgi:HK97 family phage major capsid protein